MEWPNMDGPFGFDAAEAKPPLAELHRRGAKLLISNFWSKMAFRGWYQYSEPGYRRLSPSSVVAEIADGGAVPGVIPATAGLTVVDLDRLDGSPWDEGLIEQLLGPPLVAPVQTKSGLHMLYSNKERAHVRNSKIALWRGDEKVGVGDVRGSNGFVNVYTQDGLDLFAEAARRADDAESVDPDRLLALHDLTVVG